jgi:cytochrome-b5 reductase
MDAAMQAPVLGAVALIAVGLCGWSLFRSRRRPITLDPTNKVPLKLIEKESLSHNVRRLRFALPSETHTLGLPIGKHVFVSATVGGKPISRAYSPVSSEEDNFMELVIKVYFANEHPKFPEGGAMSQYLNSLEVGDSVFVRGPMGKYEYEGRGAISIKSSDKVTRKTVGQLGMIAGGTGITPMLAIVRSILSDPQDTTQISLIFANNKEEDMFLREELEALAESHSNFKIWYTLVDPPKGWRYSTGFVSEEMIREHLPITGSRVLICGPPPMVKFACLPHLASCGVAEENILVW